jgi:DNA-directed RNA polymerase subunit M/transcription elongation factor TFIIS
LGAPGVEEVSRPVYAPVDRLDQEKGEKLDALEWLKATEIFDEADSKIPLPTWWREQANVVSIIVDVDAEGEDIGAAIREAVSTIRAESTPVPETPVPSGKRRLWALIRDLELFGTALEDDGDEEEGVTEVEAETETASDTGASDLTGVATPDTSETTVANDDRPGLGLPTTTCRCPECAHDRAQYRLVQLRSIDEPPTRLLSCVNCGQRWREDS